MKIYDDVGTMKVDYRMQIMTSPQIQYGGRHRILSDFP